MELSNKVYSQAVVCRAGGNVVLRLEQAEVNLPMPEAEQLAELTATEELMAFALTQRRNFAERKFVKMGLLAHEGKIALALGCVASH